jgi:sphinganine C4-monooxygenase
MRDVIRDVLLQHATQAVFSGVIAWFEPDTYIGGEEYDIRAWAQKIRMAQRAIPYVLLVISIDGLTMAKNVQSGFPTVAGLLAGRRYPALVQPYLTPSHMEIIAPAFVSWEMTLAKAMYQFIVPGFQYAVAMLFLDSREYWMH